MHLSIVLTGNFSKMFLENAKIPTGDYRSTSSESNFKYAKISCEHYRDTLNFQ